MEERRETVFVCEWCQKEFADIKAFAKDRDMTYDDIRGEFEGLLLWQLAPEDFYRRKLNSRTIDEEPKLLVVDFVLRRYGLTSKKSIDNRRKAVRRVNMWLNTNLTGWIWVGR